MAKSADRTRKRILAAAYELFYRKGFARVSVDEIAASARITKRTLYYHFDSKDDLLATMLESHHEMALGQIRKWGERLSGNLNAMIDLLFADLANWASKPRWSGAGFTRLVMELADLLGHPARAIASRHKAALEAWLTSEFATRKVKKPEERGRQVVLLLEGAMSLILIHRDRRYAKAAAEAAKLLVEREFSESI
jgi:AcrR family transcriptional regulator